MLVARSLPRRVPGRCSRVQGMFHDDIQSLCYELMFQHSANILRGVAGAGVLSIYDKMQEIMYVCLGFCYNALIHMSSF